MRYNQELNANLRAACSTPTSTEDNDQLYVRVLAGDDNAREQMTVNNLPLVLSVVDLFIGKRPDCQYLRDDLVAEGFLAVVNAVQRIPACQEKRRPNPTS